MTTVEDFNFKSLTLAEDKESPLQKLKNNYMESESLRPISLEIDKSKMSSILDLELIHPFEVQETENMSALVTTSTILTPSKIHNQFSVEQEIDIAIQLPVQEVENQNLSHIPSSSKVSNQENYGKISKILDLERNSCEVQETENMASPSKIHGNHFPVEPETDIAVQLPVQEVENQNPPRIISSSKLPNKENARKMCPIRDLELNPSNVPEPENMSSVATTSTRPTPSNIHNNQFSVEPVIDIFVVKKVESQNPSHGSSVSPNKEKAGSENFSLTSTEIKNLQSILRSGVPDLSTSCPSTLYKPTMYRRYLAAKLQNASMLPMLVLRNDGAESERDRGLMVLKVMEFIRMWLDKIKEMNNYYTEKYQYLIKVVLHFKRLEEMLEEKLTLLSTGSRSCSLEIQKNKASEYKTSVYETLHFRGQKILRLYRHNKRLMHADFMKYSEARVTYINGSIQISMYPFEEKIFEKEELSILINNLSKLMNNKSIELVSTSSLVDYICFECENIAKKYLYDIEVAFSI